MDPKKPSEECPSSAPPTSFVAVELRLTNAQAEALAFYADKFLTLVHRNVIPVPRLPGGAAGGAPPDPSTGGGEAAVLRYFAFPGTVFPYEGWFRSIRGQTFHHLPGGPAGLTACGARLAGELTIRTGSASICCAACRAAAPPLRVVRRTVAVTLDLDDVCVLDHAYGVSRRRSVIGRIVKEKADRHRPVATPAAPTPRLIEIAERLDDFVRLGRRCVPADRELDLLDDLARELRQIAEGGAR